MLVFILVLLGHMLLLQLPCLFYSLYLATRDQVNAIHGVPIAEKILVKAQFIGFLSSVVVEKSVHCLQTSFGDVLEQIECADLRNLQICLLTLLLEQDSMKVVL